MKNIGQIKLKIKSKHLSTEPAIIRLEIAKLRDKAAYELSKGNDMEAIDIRIAASVLESHLRAVVGVEARATFLARGFLKGLRYDQVENSRRTHNGDVEYHIAMTRALVMVRTYSYREYHNLTIGNFEAQFEVGRFAENQKESSVAA